MVWCAVVQTEKKILKMNDEIKKSLSLDNAVSCRFFRGVNRYCHLTLSGNPFTYRENKNCQRLDVGNNLVSVGVKVSVRCSVQVV